MPKFTLDELIEHMKPQELRDKALINQCVEGLALYAAQKKSEDTFSRVPDEMRKHVENLVCYWGLDGEQDELIMEDFLDAFDERVASAKIGDEYNMYRRHADTICGLHRHADDLIVSQGESAMSEILDMSDLMKELAVYWDFKPYDVIENLAQRLTDEVGRMLDCIALPGKAASGVNVGYHIQQEILFENDRGFVLAHNPKAVAPYVTWQFADREGVRGYDDGHYFLSKERARLDYMSRVDGYMQSYKVAEKPAVEKTSVKAQIKTAQAEDSCARHLPRSEKKDKKSALEL